LPLLPGVTAATERLGGWSAAILTLIGIGAGLIVDTLGDWVEAKVLDKLHDDPKRMQEEWYRYLRIAFTTEPIGQRYLRSITLHLKFELGMGIALLASLPGILYLNYLKSLLSVGWTLVVAVVVPALAGYLFWETLDSSKVLARVRKELLKGVGEPPIQ